MSGWSPRDCVEDAEDGLHDHVVEAATKDIHDKHGKKQYCHEYYQELNAE
jgi:hypothetical protein